MPRFVRLRAAVIGAPSGKIAGDARHRVRRVRENPGLCPYLT